MCEEAVFSSSEDRIRAGQATNAVAGPSIVSQGTPPGIAGVWLRHAAEGVFSVLFPSDCRICGLPLLNISRLPVCPRCLAGMHGIDGRVRDTDSQIDLTSRQRREHMRGAFAVCRSPQVIGRAVVIVDDVYTTGATVTECARMLRKAGAARVWVGTVARTLKDASNIEGFDVSKFQSFKKETESSEVEGEPLETLKL